MRDSLLIGFRRSMLPVPALLWRRLVAGNARRIAARLAFMGEAHHRVRDFVVTELPRGGRPLDVGEIAARLHLEPARVRTIVADLERHLTFLFRSRGDAVTWAYPVTVDETPHRAVFTTGEEAYSP